MRFGQTIRAEVPDIPEALRCKTVPKLFLQPVPENCIEHGIRYLRAHAGEFGIDPERIGIYGGSLGGNTALMDCPHRRQPGSGGQRRRQHRVFQPGAGSGQRLCMERPAEHGRGYQ